MRNQHPLANIAEWRKGCSCAPKESPVQCEACTEGLINAVESWFTQHRNSRILGIAGVLEDLDARAGLPMTVDAQAAAIIRHLEAELYAAQDQVAGLQELMATQRAPESLDAAVRYLVAQADDKARTHHYAVGGSPRHGHNVAGRWDGDSTHPRGSLCEECAAWDIMRQYAATDIVAETEVIEVARVLMLKDVLMQVLLAPEYLLPGAYVTEEDKTQWFRWNGEHRPINKYHLCDVVLRDGRILFNQSPYDFDWSYGVEVLAARERGERGDE